MSEMIGKEEAKAVSFCPHEFLGCLESNTCKCVYGNVKTKEKFSSL